MNYIITYLFIGLISMSLQIALGVWIKKFYKVDIFEKYKTIIGRVVWGLYEITSWPLTIVITICWIILILSLKDEEIQ